MKTNTDIGAMYDGLVCTTCGRLAGAPYRRYDARGKVVEGCVDDTHTGHLVVPSESAAWHGRREAKAIRRQLAQLRKVGR